MFDRSFSPGKVILSGEHSVVYGHPAVVLATRLGSVAQVVDRAVMKQHHQSSQLMELGDRLQSIFARHIGKHLDEVGVMFRTDLPIQSGMGSSASLAAAGLKALAAFFHRNLELDELFTLVQQSEKIVHGNPSGVDASAVVYAGMHFFKKKDSNLQRQELLDLIPQLPPFLLIQTGQPVESTKEMVQFVASRRTEDQMYAQKIEAVGDVTARMLMHLQQRKLNQFMSTVTENQRLLEELDIVGSVGAQHVNELEKFGAVVKITGAGGRIGGSGLAIAFHDDLSLLKSYCQHKKYAVLETAVFDWSQI